MSKRLLRGVIDFGDGRIVPESIRSNYRMLQQSKFEWNNPDERKIYEFIDQFVSVNLETPSSATIKDFFDRDNDLTVTEKLADIQAAETYWSKNYENLLKRMLEDQNQNKVRRLLQDVEEIVTKGRIINKETFKGVKAGIQYFNQQVYALLPPELNAITEGEVTQDTDAEKTSYQTAKVNKEQVYGRFTGIEHIDKVCHGIKKGELWIHAAESGGLKTTFALNWAYNLTTRYRANVLYVSMEMKYEHLRKLICAIHTSNGKFAAQGFRPLDYRKIRDGELTPEEEEFYYMALDDLKLDSEHCRLKVWAPDRDVSIDDIRIYSELLHKNMELGLLIMDHDELIKANKSSRDHLQERNSVLRDAKKLALHFNGGEGIPVLDLHQINRKGIASTDKSRGKFKAPPPDEEEGVYNYTHLSYAHECERSADYITTTYATKETIAQGYAKLGNMKNRDNPKFDHTRIAVDMSCHRIRNWDAVNTEDFGYQEMSQEDLGLV